MIRTQYAVDFNFALRLIDRHAAQYEQQLVDIFRIYLNVSQNFVGRFDASFSSIPVDDG